MEAPCKDCVNRGCGSHHEECQKYKDYKQHIAHIRECRSKDLLIRDDWYQRYTRLTRSLRHRGAVKRKPHVN